MKEKFLPVGTVVLLQNGTKRVMINGFCSIDSEDPDTVYDYSGVLFPEGSLSSDQTLLFNHDQIEEIYFSGYSDIEDQEFKVELKKLVEARDKTVDDAPRPFANIDSTSNEVDLY